MNNPNSWNSGRRNPAHTAAGPLTATATSNKTTVAIRTLKKVTWLGVMGVLVNTSLMVMWATVHSNGTPKAAANQMESPSILQVPWVPR